MTSTESTSKVSLPDVPQSQAPSALASRSRWRVSQSSSARRKLDRSPRSQIVVTGILVVVALYFIVPLYWVVIAATKTTGALFSTNGFWFGGEFALWSNLQQVFTYDGGIFVRWIANSILYSGVGAVLATYFAAAGGYALAKYDFRGRQFVFGTILGGVLVPATALALPLFLIFSQVDLTDTFWSVFLPSIVSPFGVYLSRLFAASSVPDEIIEAARIDGSGEVRTFFTVAVRLMSPALVTIFLFQFVAVWNNFFLPLIMLSDPKWYPLTVGLNQWNAQATGSGAQPIYNLVVTGSLLTIIPIVVAFLFLQRFWQSGLAAGSVKA
ncbi:Sugar ABC transporter permease [Exiguobacterium sp. 8A]|nr:Sugar ABC transporter permease [Exiguobacterium sp. 8A]